MSGKIASTDVANENTLPTSSGGTDFDNTDLIVGGNTPPNEPANSTVYICQGLNVNAVIINAENDDTAAIIAKAVSENPLKDKIQIKTSNIFFNDNSYVVFCKLFTKCSSK